MSDVSTSPTDTAMQPPFVLELRSENLQSDGNFTPAAAVLLTPALRRSGLLKLLSADDLRTLLGVLSCLTPNGNFAATPELLAPALGLSTGQARDRLQRLTRQSWQGKPLLSEQPTESGLRFFVLADTLFAVQKSYVLPEQAVTSPSALATCLSSSGQTIQGGYREQIIAHSRALYARPRAEVEEEINRFLGFEKEEEKVPATPEEAARLELMKRMVAIGMDALQADLILNGYPHDQIERQLAWLPYRKARNPVAFLVAAIEHNYDPPLGVRVPLAHQDAPTIESAQDKQEQTAEEAKGADNRVTETAEMVELELPPDTAGMGTDALDKAEPEFPAPDDKP